MNQKDYIIRLEKEEEQREVEYLVRESFWNVYHTPEGYYVDEQETDEFDKQFPHLEKAMSSRLGVKTIHHLYSSVLFRPSQSGLMRDSTIPSI